MYKETPVCIVAAMGRDRGLGKNDKLNWHIPDDLKRFKQLTLGHPVIMGRKTFESIVGYLGRPLPNRKNIVLTRDRTWRYEGVDAVSSIEDALEKAHTEGGSEIHIGGGAQLYTQMLPYVDRLYLTLIDDVREADTFFPPYEDDFTEVKREDRETDGLRYAWVDMKRSV